MFGLDYTSVGEHVMNEADAIQHGGGAGTSQRPDSALAPVAAACRALVERAQPPRGRAAAVCRLPALLRRADVAVALAAAAGEEGEAGGPATEALVCAAWAGRADMLAALTRAGARVSVHTLAAAFPLRIGPGAFPGSTPSTFSRNIDPSRCDALQGVRLLLAHGGAAAACAPLPAGAKPHWHPLLRMLADFKAERGEFGLAVRRLRMWHKKARRAAAAGAARDCCWPPLQQRPPCAPPPPRLPCCPQVSETGDVVTRPLFDTDLARLEAWSFGYLQAHVCCVRCVLQGARQGCMHGHLPVPRQRRAHVRPRPAALPFCPFDCLLAAC